MIKIFRELRRQLVMIYKFDKYILYAIGEIILIVVGILIAVGIGEWRSNVKNEQELKSYYESLYYDLNQDKESLDSLIILFDTASRAIYQEIDKMQTGKYTQDSLYSNVPGWMVYLTEFTPSKPTYMEIISSGKLQLFTNEDIKKQLLKVYNSLYPEVQFRQTATNDYIRSNRTEGLMDTYRWLMIVRNDGQEYTTIDLKNNITPLKHDWLSDRQSDKYLRFENYLTITGSSYQGFTIRYRKIIPEIEYLMKLMKDELNK
ncbi:DUF6090 family protein [Aegicerativicinus sediminis]